MDSVASVKEVESSNVECANSVSGGVLEVSGCVSGGGEEKCRSVDVVLGEKEKGSVGGAEMECQGAEGGEVGGGAGVGSVEAGAGEDDMSVEYEKVPQMSRQRLKEIRRHLTGKGECCWCLLC